jgi:hypothetical protein
VTSPFEEPKKADMRARAIVAIDAAGYELLTSPRAFPIPEGLTGTIKGDLQSLNGEQVCQAYYLRPAGSKPIPQWLVNLAAAARDIDDLLLFVVVTDVSSVLEKSCRASGVGLLRLTDDDTFELVVDPEASDPVAIASALEAEIKSLRRRLETKLELNKSALEQNYSKVNELTAGMPSKTRDQYIETVEQAAGRWDEWGIRVSESLDEAGSTGNAALVQAAERMIEEGAEDEDPHEAAA